MGAITGSVSSRESDEVLSGLAFFIWIRGGLRKTDPNRAYRSIRSIRRLRVVVFIFLFYVLLEL